MSSITSTDDLKRKYLYLFSGAFLLIIAAAILFEFLYLLAIPLAIIGVTMLIYRTEWLVLSMAFLTPLAVNLEQLNLGIGMSLPTEPIIFGLMVLYVLMFIGGHKIDKKILKHPVSVAILFYLFWSLVTTVTSSMPLVSMKHTLARFWFIIVFYFLLLEVLRNPSNLRRFVWMYLAGLILVVIYTTIHHATFAFSERAAHWVMNPFYNDHTAYAAVLALFLPVTIALAIDKNTKGLWRWAAVACVLILSIAIVLSYTRAAWVSLAVAAGVFMVYYFRIKFSIIMLAIVLIGGTFFAIKDTLIMRLEKNRQDSSTELASHVQSITNISTDASNLERINRWNSALRMFMERPFFGWGPGTYMFQYAPFQKSSELTIISSNLGKGGNAHSEYLGPLAESGVIGTLSFVVLLIVFLYRASITYSNLSDPSNRKLLLGLLLGLITYMVHGFLNNFLDTDKAAVPFYGFIAIVVALDIYYRQNQLTD